MSRIIVARKKLEDVAEALNNGDITGPTAARSIRTIVKNEMFRPGKRTLSKASTARVASKVRHLPKKKKRA